MRHSENGWEWMMRMLAGAGRMLLCVLLAVFLTACQAEKSSGPMTMAPAVEHQAQPRVLAEGLCTSYPPNGQANFVSKTGGFEIYFPGDPERTTRNRRSVVGEFFSLEQDSGTYYAGYFVHPYKGLDNMILKRAISRVEEKVSGKLHHVREISFRSYEGREFRIESSGSDGVVVLGRYYCAGNTVYVTRYTAPKSEFEWKEATAFLDSFNMPAQTRTADCAPGL